MEPNERKLLVGLVLAILLSMVVARVAIHKRPLEPDATHSTNY
jgi:hypothetical protein